jgi:hypothetical protein
MMQRSAAGFEKMMKNASSPDVVAKVVLNAIRDKNPSLRYLAGSDVETWLGGKKKVADEEFYKMMVIVAMFVGFNMQNCCTTCLLCGKNVVKGYVCWVSATGVTY